MLIRVMYSDNRYDFVQDTHLDRLIQDRSITMFQRKSGWVRVSIDPIRHKSRHAVAQGQERRKTQ